MYHQAHHMRFGLWWICLMIHGCNPKFQNVPICIIASLNQPMLHLLTITSPQSKNNETIFVYRRISLHCLHTDDPNHINKYEIVHRFFSRILVELFHCWYCVWMDMMMRVSREWDAQIGWWLDNKADRDNRPLTDTDNKRHFGWLRVVATEREAFRL